MTRLGLLRHAPTSWNLQKRLQGHADLPLDPEYQGRLAGMKLPDDFRQAVWHTSPLIRARETANMFAIARPRIEPRLIEMDFGAFEGRTLADIRTELGPEMQRNEARGLDFCPPDGESPRQVMERLGPWLRACADAGGDHVAVTHKGVIRACLALAFDWDMRDKPPVKLEWSALHVFTLLPDGRLQPLEMNRLLVSE